MSFLKHIFWLNSAVVNEISGSSMTKQISADGQSRSSLISDGDQDGFGSSFSTPVFCLWMLTVVLELQCSYSSLRKGIIFCKWYSVTRDLNFRKTCPKDAHRGQPSTYGILALLFLVYSSFWATTLWINSVSGDSVQLYTEGGKLFWINSPSSCINFCMPAWF